MTSRGGSMPTAPGKPGHPGSWLMVSAIIAAIVLGIAQGIPATIEALGLIFGMR